MLTHFSSLPWLPWILMGALAARLGAAVVVQRWVDQTPGRLCLIEGDADGYWQLARHLVRGEDFAIYEPPRFVERMPGFPLLLACGMNLFGENPLWIRVLLAFVGTGACGLVYCLGRDLFDAPTGLIACCLASVSPVFIVFSVLLLSETFFGFGLLASLLALVKVAGFESQLQSKATTLRRIGLAIIAGLLAGAATLIRPTWILVAPIFVVMYLMAPGNRRARLVPGALLIAALGVVLAPWTIRNYRVTGRFVPTTLWVGPSLYDGLSPTATGASDMRFIETDSLYGQPGMSEYEVDRHYRKRAFDFVRDQPGRALVLAAKKLWRFWNPVPNAEQFGHWAIRAGVGLFETPVLLLAGVGFWKSRATLWRWLPAAGPVLYFALVHVVFVGSLRYRLPAEFPLLVLTAVGCRWLGQRFRPPASTS